MCAKLNDFYTLVGQITAYTVHHTFLLLWGQDPGSHNSERMTDYVTKVWCHDTTRVVPIAPDC